MLTGRYLGTDARPGRPYTRVEVEFPDLGRSGIVPLLIDTGADASMIGPDDAKLLKLLPLLSLDHPGVRLSPNCIIGIGAEVRPYLVRARFSFLAVDQNTCLETRDFEELDVVAPWQTQSRFMSVLGWDVLADLEEFGFSWPRREIYSVQQH